MDTAHAAFQQFLDAYRDAALAKDVDAFVRPYDEDVHVFDMWNDWSLHGRASWRRMAAGWFGSLGDERVQVEFDDVGAFACADMICGHATVTYTALSADGRKLRSLSNRMTAVLQRRGGEWKVVHEHTSAPIEHTTLKAIPQRPA
ncbi:YybH family protein [Lysobacter arvi]|uniref:Nuclear transport factor 2 family protein n=1 Tax=Lysobacter arvi TaxID=3038776 RepID=A0ABU1CC59_9GAMM|nr:nuclear transport factor 2 family protein [Lysobacter arvi]MDR0182710.1 nuclear transport factor 2 family protein [Lysobacter arvi]